MARVLPIAVSHCRPLHSLTLLLCIQRGYVYTHNSAAWVKGLTRELIASCSTKATVSQQIRPLQANLTRCLHNISLCYANVLKLASRRGCGCGRWCRWLGWRPLLKSFLCRCMSAGKTAWALSHHYQMPPPLTTSSITYIHTYIRMYIFI